MEALGDKPLISVWLRAPGLSRLEPRVLVLTVLLSYRVNPSPLLLALLFAAIATLFNMVEEDGSLLGDTLEDLILKGVGLSNPSSSFSILI